MQKTIKAKLNTDINWNTTIFMILFHMGAVAALFFFSWKAIVISLLLAWIAGSLGIGMGFHRLLTHRGFKTPKLVEYFLTICGTLTLEGGAINWVVTHRIHHAHTEQPGDPHSPREGPLRHWASGTWWLAGLDVGHILPRHVWTPRDLVSEFCDPSLGLATL